LKDPSHAINQTPLNTRERERWRRRKKNINYVRRKKEIESKMDYVRRKNINYVRRIFLNHK
jgi:hypothetical protein